MSSTLLQLKCRMTLKTALFELESTIFISEIVEIGEIIIWMYNLFLMFEGLKFLIKICKPLHT